MKTLDEISKTPVEVDATLIAAAPDLLAALKRILHKFEVCARLHGNDDEVISEVTSFAREAIAKATGGRL
jgi:hypothetical protein